MDKVSIIIPAYNMAKFVPDAIDSALAQTYDNIEVIVVDDGSTDDTEHTIKQKYFFSEQKAKILAKLVYWKKKNAGTASALNLGIKLSKGDWIHWLSADDMLMPASVENMLIHIKQYPQNEQENAIFFSDYYQVNEKGEKVGEYREPQRNHMPIELLQQHILNAFFGNGSTSMIHRSIFDRIGFFDEIIPYFEDYEFWLRACVQNKMKLVHIPQFTLLYRLHEGQMSRKVDMRWNEKIRNKILGNTQTYT